ncbi:MAG: histidine kinase [Methylibium sp. NZG]|nr:MAG: histidine kinase [Methylibium sp. NZG]
MRRSALPDQVRTIYEFLPATLAGFVAGVGVVTMLFWKLTPASVLLPWMGAFVVMALARWIIAQRFKRADPQTESDWLRWRLYSNIGTLVAGLLWGVTGWIFYDRGDSAQQTGLIVIVYTFAVAAVPVLSTQPRMFLAFVSLCFLPLVVRIALGGGAANYQLAGELLLIISLTALLARYYRQALQRVLELKLQADELLAQLRVEKQAAEEARREAEVANRAKTQFFTAASHDLRQPLHAMGLFAEALRQRVHEPEVAHLVNSINESVDALEGLFSELLDITRIDSGGVEVLPRHFQMEDIYRKLRLHFEPMAFEKGLALRLRGGQRAVLADPLLVERVLRNLVANAIRYTHDGTVLVGCRPRGDTVVLQVWDSGPGIAPEQQALIFEEFYQVPGSNAAQPHQRKGLGLGLAIVKRLAGLMQAPLRLASTPGRGSVFSLVLPLGKATAPQVASRVGKGPLELTLDGRLIVIVEDEPVVRSSLEVLLQGWGARIESFDSVAASSAWARACPPSQPTPHLLIVDYRLENGLNGVQAIQVLRQRFGAGVPAIVVTGSTMTGHEHEAQEHDFHVLTKPVLPNKLRAMIAFKLGVQSQGARG